MLAFLPVAGLGPAARAPEPVRRLHFGFVIVDAGHDDPHDAATTTNYIDEVAPFCDLADIAVFSPGEVIGPRIDAMNARGVEPIIHVQAVLFDSAPDAGSPSGTRLFLRPDAEARWDTFVAANALTQRQGDLAAVYLADEPAWNGLADDQLASAAEWVQRDLPSVPSMLIEAPPTIGDLFVPASVDWIGFDHYAVLDPSTDPAWQADLARLRTRKTRPGQRIVIVMESQWLPIYGDAGVTPEMMGGVAANYFIAASRCPDAVAMLGYTWPGGFGQADQLGARDLPASVRSVYQAIGRRLTGRH